MKKIVNVLLIGMISLLLLPFIVSAEVKTFGDIKYIIEEKDTKEYVCEEIKDHELEIMPFSDIELYVNDITENKIYLVDITNPGVCKEFNAPTNMDAIRLEWKENNEIYEVKYDMQLVYRTLYVSELDEMIMFTRATGQYDSNKEYYEIINNGSEDEAILVTNSNEADFNDDKYLTILEPKSKTLLGQIDPTTLVAPKEKTGLTDDLTFTKDTFIGTPKFNNKTYYAFYSETYQDYAAIFDEEGNYQTFGHEELLVSNFSTSIDGEYILLTYDQDGEIIMEVLDTSYNLVLSKKLDDYTIHFIGKNENTDYIFDIDYNNMQSKITSITKSTIEKENVPNTYDGITTSIIVGVIALLGLAVTTILYRKKAN